MATVSANRSTPELQYLGGIYDNLGGSTSLSTGIGSVTETAPTTDTASSGLNGRLQRIAQRITSLIALLPTALGQGTMATSFKVVLPSDQSPIPISGNTFNLRVPGATVAATGAYVTGDLVGTKLTLTDAMRISGGSGYLMSVIIEDLSAQSLALDVVIFDSDPSGTTFTDNSALDIADADIAKVLGCVSIAASDYFAFADNSVAVKSLINLPVIASGSANLFACIVARSSPTYSANELSIKFGFERN